MRRPGPWGDLVDSVHRVRPLRASDPARLGEYLLVGRLGAGGMGVVYLGEGADGSHVAIKVIHADLASRPESAARFRSEVRRAQQVPSSCTARFLGADLDHEPPYLVVEYIDGPSVTEVVEERGPLPAGPLHSLAVGIATALTGIHGAGVIHRDLKPGNVLLPPGGTKVIDFGIAQPFEVTTQLTAANVTVGTVSYMAPERLSARYRGSVTAAADVFSWGCVVAYAGTGRTPFGGDSQAVIATRIETEPPNLDGLPAPLLDTVSRALSKDPADRPTAQDLLAMLATTAGAAQDRPDDAAPGDERQDRALARPTPAARQTVPPAGGSSAPPVGWHGAHRPPRPVRSVRRMLLVAAAVLAVLVAVGAGVAGYLRYVADPSVAAGTGTARLPDRAGSPSPAPPRPSTTSSASGTADGAAPSVVPPASAGATANATPTRTGPAPGPTRPQVQTGYIGTTDAIVGPGEKCVDDDTNMPDAGDKIQLWDCNGVAGQQWTFSGDDTARVYGLCMDVAYNDTADGSLVRLWDCDGTGGEKWKYRTDGSLYNPQSGRCLDDPDHQTADGTQLQIWDCDGQSSQVWNLA